MKNHEKAVIYCRVSSQAQVKKGDGLASQETRCREYARMHGYEVVEVFYDEGISGKLLERAKMRELLNFLKRYQNKHNHIVIIDDISRLARDLETHIKLRAAISEAGGKLESPAIEFGEDSDSRLVEHLLASVAAHQREKNAEQVKNRMRARMQNGYWVFKKPIGYKFERKSGHGKVLVPDEPLATIVRQAFEGFACGKFESQSEVMYFLASKPQYPKDADGSIHISRVKELFERILYTGYMEYPEWGIPLQLGKHTPLISFDTYNRVQERLKQKAKAPIRKDIHLDFPLRGFVLCASCNRALTACWSQGKYNKFPYYLCRNKDCVDCKKSVRKEVMEQQFEDILHELTPTPDLLMLMRAAVKHVWQKQITDYDQYVDGLRHEMRETERKIEQFLDRIVASDSDMLIRTYETKVTQLESHKSSIDEKLRNSRTVEVDFDTSFQTVFDFIGNPHKLWASGEIENQRLVLKLVFNRQLPYCRNSGFQTPEYSQPFKVSRGFIVGQSEMVEPRGVEPLTSTLPALRSTN